MSEQNPEKGAMTPEKSQKFSNLAETIFAPVYPMIAQQILARTNITKGVGLDIGCGPGDLSIEVAKHSSITVYALDISPEMISIATKKIIESNMSSRVIPVVMDVHRMKCADNSIDLVFSRGSWFFWEDLHIAFSEIYRVLSPSGICYIGAGFGNAVLREQIVTEMNQCSPEWRKGDQLRDSQSDPDLLRPVLQDAGFSNISFIQDNSGFWMLLRK